MSHIKIEKFKKLAYPHFTHYFNLFVLSGKGGESFYEDQNIATWSLGLSDGFYNTILFKEEGGNSWKKECELALSEFEARKLPFSCIVTESEHKREIQAFLENKGLHTPGPFTFLSLDLSKNNFKKREAEPIVVKRVLDDQELHQWTDLFTTVFFPKQKEESYRFYYDHYQKLGYGEHAPIWHYIGYVKGEPVGASSLLLTLQEGQPIIAGLWNGCVVERGRRQGVGQAMALERIHAAQELGFPILTTILMSDGMAWGYCKPLGFEREFEIEYYHRS